MPKTSCTPAGSCMSSTPAFSHSFLTSAIRSALRAPWRNGTVRPPCRRGSRPPCRQPRSTPAAQGNPFFPAGEVRSAAVKRLPTCAAGSRHHYDCRADRVLTPQTAYERHAEFENGTRDRQPGGEIEQEDKVWPRAGIQSRRMSTSIVHSAPSWSYSGKMPRVE